MTWSLCHSFCLKLQQQLEANQQDFILAAELSFKVFSHEESVTKWAKCVTNGRGAECLRLPQVTSCDGFPKWENLFFQILSQLVKEII